MNFTPEDIDYLGKLYRHERHNSYAYSQISNFLNVQGYSNLSKYYEEWSNHEMEHSILVRDFVNSNNIIIDMSQSIVGLDIDLSNMSITQFAQITIDVENETTLLYNVFLDMGRKELKGFIERFSLDFLLEQIEETDNTIFDQLNNIGNNRALLQIFDNNFGD
jgi:ferritin